MGGTASKQASLNMLQNLNSDEQFSLWEMSLFSEQDGKQATIHFIRQQHILNISVTDSFHLKFRFFFRTFKRWHDGNTTGSYGTRGVSLWVAVAMDGDHQQTFIFSIKIHKRVVNGMEDGKVDDCTDTTFHRDVSIQSNGRQETEILLQDQFLVLAILRKMDIGEEKEIQMFLQESGPVKLKVNFAVSITFGNVQGVTGDRDEESKQGLLLRGNAKTHSEGASYLVKDLKKLYSDDDMLSDVALKSKDGMTLKAHKIILASRSPYFRRWIQWSPSSFSTGAPVTIENVNAKPLLAVLHWMYSGELLQDTDTFLGGMIEAAIKFEMNDLLKILEKRKLARGSCSNCLSCSGKRSTFGTRKLDRVRKFKRALLAWFPLLRHRFGHRPVGLVASIINAIYGIYELF